MKFFVVDVNTPICLGQICVDKIDKLSMLVIAKRFIAKFRIRLIGL